MSLKIEKVGTDENDIIIRSTKSQPNPKCPLITYSKSYKSEIELESQRDHKKTSKRLLPLFLCPKLPLCKSHHT